MRESTDRMVGSSAVADWYQSPQFRPITPALNWIHPSRFRGSAPDLSTQPRSSQISRHLLTRRGEILIRDSVAPIDTCRLFLGTADCHCHLFWDAGPHHISDCAAAEIVE